MPLPDTASWSAITTASWSTITNPSVVVAAIGSLVATSTALLLRRRARAEQDA
jgi:hypothetical protein